MRRMKKVEPGTEPIGRRPNYDQRLKRRLLDIIEGEATRDTDRLKAIELWHKFYAKAESGPADAKVLAEQVKAAQFRVARALGTWQGKPKPQEEEKEGGKEEKGTLGDEEIGGLVEKKEGGIGKGDIP